MKKGEPVVMFMVRCSIENIELSLVKDAPPKTLTTKDKFTVYVTLMDVVCLIILIWFSNKLSKQKLEFAESFDEQTIQMNHFTVMLKNMPTDDYFGSDENILRARLWDHIEKVLQKQAIKEGETDIDKDSNKFLVTDITFANNTMNETKFLDSFKKKQKEIIQETARRESYTDEKSKLKSTEKIEKLEN